MKASCFGNRKGAVEAPYKLLIYRKEKESQAKRRKFVLRDRRDSGFDPGIFGFLLKSFRFLAFLFFLRLFLFFKLAVAAFLLLP